MSDLARRVVAALVLVLALGACRIAPVEHAVALRPAERCSTISHPITLAPPPPGRVTGEDPEALVEAADPLAEAIVASFSAPDKNGPERPAHPRGPVAQSMLLLSGGSQNGAFGAGFLDGWAARRPGGLPRFATITGVSTGSLQATFAFLGQTGRVVRAYQIEREEKLLHPFSKGMHGKGALAKLDVGLTIATRGTAADLQPLREFLHELIDRETLLAVAAEADEGRKLLAGAVEIDSGEARAFDLTQAAQRYRAGEALMRECYIEVLMASSSVPMAALPVFIDGEMYIDGGARFGVISEFLARTYARAAREMPGDAKKNLYVLVNGTLEPGETCDLGTCTEKARISAPKHGKWSFDGLALRSMNILINQSYRASVYLAGQEGARAGFALHFVRITPELAAHRFTLGPPLGDGQPRTCAQWHDVDRRQDNPLEFHPRFMHCEVDFGRKRAGELGWAGLE